MTSGQVRELLVRVNELRDATSSSTINSFEQSEQGSTSLKLDSLKTEQESWNKKFQASLGISPQTLSFILGSGALLGITALDLATTGGAFTLPSLLHSTGALAMISKSALAALHPLAGNAITMGHLNLASITHGVACTVKYSLLGALSGAALNGWLRGVSHSLNTSDNIEFINFRRQGRDQRVLTLMRDHEVINGQRVGFAAGGVAGAIYGTASFLVPALGLPWVVVPMVTIAGGFASHSIFRFLARDNNPPPLYYIRTINNRESNGSGNAGVADD